MSAIGWKDVEQRLDVTLPAAYRRALGDRPNAFWPDKSVYFLTDAREILIQNLELRMSPRDDGFAGARWPANFICIGPDGCGNYYAISADDPACTVQFFDHEVDEFQSIAENLPEFFRYVTDILEQGGSLRPDMYEMEDSVIPAKPSSDAVLTRADVPRESVLNPITLDEWTRFVESDPDLEMRGYRSMINPFTQAEIRGPCPGLAALAGGVSNREFLWLFGRVSVNRPGEQVLEKLRQAATALGANVLTDW